MTYPWSRYWGPRGERYNLVNGYLDDSDFARLHGRSQAALFDALRHVPCLVLLGEPGIGKSSAINHEFALAAKNVIPGVIDVHKVDLREISDLRSFFQEAFEHEEVNAWKSGSGTLTLFIDSLDEGLIEMGLVAPLVARGLKTLPTDRLRLRIACRTAVWPRNLEEALNGLWPNKGDIEFRELLPLTYSQVHAAAEARGLEPLSFMAMLSKRELQPLAIKPITLDFLLDAFSRNEASARTRAEVYEQGCLRLCEDKRWDAGPKRSELSTSQLMEVVSRIAAVLVFCRKAAVWTGLEGSLLGTNHDFVRVSELIGGPEDDGTGAFQVTEVHVRDALRTALFSSRGLDRLGWAHQTYAEFLASRYIMRKGFSAIQIRSLIKSADDPEQKLIPQLQETVAWMVGNDPALYQDVLKSDPAVVLRSDVANTTPEQKAQLVTGLVHAFGAGLLSYHTSGLFDRYERLTFPGIGDLLRRLILAEDLNDTAKDCAIDIAFKCEAREVAPEVCAIALDPLAAVNMRITAAHFIAACGGPDERKKLRPLVDGVAEDHNDDLKGYALKALWPEHISAEEVFGLLTEPKEPNILGGYKDFFSRNFAVHLKREHMPVALAWVRAHQEKGRMEDRLDDLVSEVMYLGWTYLDGAPWMEEYVSAVLLRLRIHGHVVGGFSKPRLFHDELSSNTERRKTLVRALMGQADEEVVFLNRHVLLRAGDVHWMLEEVKHARGLMAGLWTRLVRDCFQSDHTDEVKAILELAVQNDALYKQFEDLIKPDNLDDPAVQKRREQFLHRRREQDQPAPVLRPSLTARVESHLDRFESGDLDAWWKLVYHHMILTPDGRSSGELVAEPDLSNFPGWMDADEPIRIRMLRAAKKFVEEFDPGTDQWLGRNCSYKPALVAYKSFRLLQSTEPQALDDLTPDRWAAWTPIILEHFVSNEVNESESSRKLAERAYMNAPHAAQAVLPALLRGGERRGRYTTVLDRLSGCWNSDLSEVVFPMLTEGVLRDHTWTVIMERLLKAGYQPAVDMACSMVDGTGVNVGADLRVRIVALLLEQLSGDQWFAVWKELAIEVDFAKEVLLVLCNRRWRPEHWFANGLSEQQVVNLFKFLERHWPREAGSKSSSDTVIHIPHRMEVGEFRDSLLWHLRDRGTTAACAALESIHKEYPQYEWLQRMIQAAKENNRRRSWSPPSPQELLTMGRDRAARRIAGPRDLMEVVMESLELIDQRLQGDTPEVSRLWNEAQESCRPKDEEALSDYLKSELTKELKPMGISIAREEQTRQTSPSCKGERLDLRVTASTTDERGERNGTASVILEVKGSWHPELRKAMSTQLVKRYMVNNRCDFGVYVVGWYDSKKWDDGDGRKSASQRRNKEKASTELIEQAAQLTDETRVVKVMILDLSW